MGKFPTRIMKVAMKIIIFFTILISFIIKADNGQNFDLLKIDDYNEFLGLKENDTLEKTIAILGKPSRIEENRIDNSPEYSINYIWEDKIETNCWVSITSDYSSHPKKIYSICISSDKKDFLNRFHDSSKIGTIHFIKTKNRYNYCVKLLGFHKSEIIKLFGQPNAIEKKDQFNNFYYNKSKGGTVLFSFGNNDEKLFRIIVFFNWK